MREFFVQKLDPEIGSLFLLHSFSECGILILSNICSILFFDWRRSHPDENPAKYVTDGKTYDSLRRCKIRCRLHVKRCGPRWWRHRPWQLYFLWGSVILFPQMDGVFPFSRFYLQTNVFLTALTARIIVTPMSGGLPLPRRKSANWRWNFTGGIILKVFF